MKQPYYKTCPVCGAHLDPGELCDCMGREYQQERGAADEHDGSSAGSTAQVSARLEPTQCGQTAAVYGAILVA